VSATIDALIVGAGPAGLAAAIRLRQRLTSSGRDASVVVIDKAPRPGYHCLSGASFPPACLDELIPGWRDDRRLREQLPLVERDELYLLWDSHSLRVPTRLVPAAMDHRGDVTTSLARLVGFLADHAERAGAEVHGGFSARSLIVEDGRVSGVVRASSAATPGEAPSQLRPAEEVRAR
jgi:electron-transferring-flavoprotein dehydrogenase